MGIESPGCFVYQTDPKTKRAAGVVVLSESLFHRDSTSAIGGWAYYASRAIRKTDL